MHAYTIATMCAARCGDGLRGRRGRYLPLFCLFAVAAVLATAGCARHEGADREPQPSDTLYTADAAMAIYDSEPERALLIIDSAEVVGNIDDYTATFLRAKVFSQSTNLWPSDTARQMLESLLDDDAVYADLAKREAVLDLLVTISRMRDDNVGYLRWATEKVDLCREQGDETEALRTEAEIGVIMCQMGEEEKGFARLNGIIATLDGQRHFNELDACVIAIRRKIAVLFSLGRESEVVPLARRILDKFADYSQHPDVYADGSYRMPPNDREFQRYCNFNTAKAYSYLTSAYAAMGLQDSARRYLALFEGSGNAQSVFGQLALARVYQQLGEYDKMKALYDKAYSNANADTLSNDYASMLYGRAMAAEAEGNYRAANNYMKRYSARRDDINKRLLDSRSYEYAARYQLQEVEMNVERERTRANNTRQLALLFLLAALVATAMAVWLATQRRALKRKDRVLVEQIAESVKLRAASDENPSEAGSQAVATGRPERKPLPEVDVEALDDRELFAHLSEAIRQEKLYLDPNFGRQTLVDCFHVTDRRIGAAFQHGNGLPEFVRELRLDHACRLLVDRTDMSINNVALASGFSSLPVFSREFKRKYDVTPTYYRQQMADQG